MKEIKIITGNAKEVEIKINKLKVHSWVNIIGFQATNETVTIIIDIENK